MGLFSGEVPVEIWCRRDMLFAEREGEGIPKRVIRVCGVWSWRSCDHSKRTQLHLGRVCCRGQILQIWIHFFFINIIIIFFLVLYGTLIMISFSLLNFDSSSYSLKFVHGPLSIYACLVVLMRIELRCLTQRERERESKLRW